MKSSPYRLNQCDLAQRWSISERTLERWRWQRQGPPYLKLGGRVLYRLEDIETFEAEQLRMATGPGERAATASRDDASA